MRRSSTYISQRLEARVRSTQQARRNTFDGLSVLQIGEAALGETSGLLILELIEAPAEGELGAGLSPETCMCAVRIL